MLETINKGLGEIDNIVWGPILIILILLTGIFLTIRLRGLQVRHLGKALSYLFKKEEGQEGKGEISSFGAFCTALSATIGTGNIVGVATAIVAGGPGALFWMWIAAVFGMATKFSEGVLAVKYRVVDQSGHALGGPFYYIENGMGKHWRWLGKVFSIFGVMVGILGIGTFTQVNGITSAVKGVFDPKGLYTVQLLNRNYSLAVIISGVILTVCVALVIIGGVKRISKVAEKVVPFMAIIYISICLFMIISHINEVPAAVVEIVASAFGFRAAAGGALGAMMVAVQKGVARGIFSNEAGLGSAPIAAATAKTHSPVRQGLVTMTGTFVDTVVVCSMTGIAIVLTGSWHMGLEGVAVTTEAFKQGLPFSGEISAFILMTCLIFFAFTTILGWNFYSERCLEYLTNGNMKVVKIYRWFYILAVFIGPFMTISAVWTIADICNALMALPNLVALIALNGVVVAETKQYFDNLDKGHLPVRDQAEEMI